MINWSIFYNRHTTLKFILHIIYWYACIWLFFGTASPDPNVSFWGYFPTLLLKISPVIIFTYINHLILIPRFFKNKWVWAYILLIVFGIVFFSFLIILIKLKILGEPIDQSYKREIVFAVSWILIFGGLAFVLKILREWLRIQDVSLKLKDVQKQKVEAELFALKAQVNPHFLFNTLNNIYSLSLDKSERTPELILKLADLMNYTLYECKEESVLISKEIEFINNYIELERIRLNNEVRIGFDIRGQFNDVRVAPLLFIPFIENAFKHGVNQRPSNPYVDIVFDFTTTQTIRFSIENAKPEISQQNGETGGIGIANVKKRLELLYGNRYNLEIIDSIDKFKVELIIAIA